MGLGKTGRPPKPIEEKRRLGNPGQRRLPDPAKVIALPGASEPPEPHRPLGRVGRELWDRVWTCGARWLAAGVDVEQVLIVCEQSDERQRLRGLVLQEGAWRDRNALRAIDAQVMDGLSLLGFNPTARARLGVAEVRPQSALDELLERRAKSG